MKTAKRLAVAGGALALLLALLSCGKKEPASENTKQEEKKEEKEGEEKKSVAVRMGIDHSAWDRLTGKYVDGAGLVAYERWKSDATDREALKSYLEQFAATPEPSAAGNELGASLTNAYNALTVSWVLENFPTESIRALKDSFTEARHMAGGERVSLDDIEHGTLRPKLGYRVHAAVSCASLSCPPLSSDAYTADGFEGQLDAAMSRWLARGDLNRILPAERKVQISEVFKWFLEDFQKAGGLRSVLGKYAPAQYRDFLAREDYEIEYMSYDWGLNDQNGLGKDYSKLQLLKDKVKEKL